MNNIRKVIGIATAGVIWFFALNLFFVWSGAQSVLANPAYQSAKFLKAFTAEPLPRAAESFFVVLAGFWGVGAIAGAVFVWLNDKLNYGWLKKGVAFGLIQWALMIPWFEFYLPFNVMLEPLSLVLLEMFLWLGVTLTVGIYLSFVFNFRVSRKS